jgi:LuxR family quorum-sensing system transcriptional regulator CciR
MAQFRDVQEFVRLSKSARDLDELRSLVDDITKEFGFSFFLLSHHVNVVRANIVQFSNYPEDWSNAMRRKSHFATDPVVRACQKTAAPFLWSELDRLITLSTAQREILAGAARAGMGPGLSVPLHVPGECTGSGSFAVASGRMLDERTIPSIQYVACFAFERARRLTQRLSDLQPSISDLPGLTGRQLDCIVLMAQGKSDWDSGKILGISQRTVQEHLDTARKRYGVGSRTQLLVRVLYDAQLGFEDVMPA